MLAHDGIEPCWYGILESGLWQRQNASAAAQHQCGCSHSLRLLEDWCQRSMLASIKSRCRPATGLEIHVRPADHSLTTLSWAFAIQRSWLRSVGGELVQVEQRGLCSLTRRLREPAASFLLLRQCSARWHESSSTALWQHPGAGCSLPEASL